MVEYIPIEEVMILTNLMHRFLLYNIEHKIVPVLISTASYPLHEKLIQHRQKTRT